MPDYQKMRNRIRSPAQDADPNPGLSRRDFLRLSATASMGLATGSLWMPGILRAATNDTSRVVIVIHDEVSSGSTIHPEVVRWMVDAGVIALKNTTTASQAWLSLFPGLAPDVRVGIKTNSTNEYLPSHPEVALPIAESLASTPVGPSNYPLNQILIWDRRDGELEDAGYIINDSTSGVRCFGTDHPGIGSNPTSIEVNGTLQQISRCYTDHSDFLINLSCMKNHNMAGATFALKNHYGSVNHANYLHDNYIDPSCPALNLAVIDEYGCRQKLCICDAIFGCHSGGAAGPPNFEYKGIVISEDPVALDAVCRQILDDHGCTTTHLSHYIDTASEAPYNLGISNLEDIEIITVENPPGIRSGGGEFQPDEAALGKNYPEPFNAATSIPVSLDRPGEVRLELHNMRGRKINTLYRGTLSAGRHTFSWDGLSADGRPASSGRYLIRLTSNGKSHSRTITLLR